MKAEKYPHIYAQLDAIIKLLKAKKEDGSRFNYGEILQLLHLENTPRTQRVISQIACDNHHRRKKPFHRRVIGTMPQEETIPLMSGKDKFLEACRVFADSYFGE